MKTVFWLCCCSSILLPTTAFVSRQPSTRAHLITAKPPCSLSALFQTSKDNEGESTDDEPDEIFFDDFGGAVIGGDADLAKPLDIAQEALQARIRATQQEDLKRETKLLSNWKKGDWSVRGFSLDPVDALSEASSSAENLEDGGNGNILPQKSPTPIYVSKVVADVNSHGSRIWVGRSNGSLVWVQLGQEYLAHFQSRISGSFTDNNSDNSDGQPEDEDAPSSTSARFDSQLVRESGQAPMFGSEDSTSDEVPVEMSSPFKILAQCSLNQESVIANILPIPDEDLVFTTCKGSGQIQQWHISEDDIGSVTPALSSPVPLSEGIHNEDIVTLKLIYYQDSPLLFSVGSDGSLALWDIFKGDLIYHCQVSVEDIGESEEEDLRSAADPGATTSTSRVIHCADVNDNHIYLGTASGFVLGYDVEDLLNTASSGGSCPLPKGKFKAHIEGVTAIACGGPGSLGRGGSTSSVVLITGGASGLVKQWEILSSPSSPKLENWPKIPTQRLPKKAHMFEGHYGPITALEAMGGERPQFLSASQDGTIRAWDVAKGEERYLMDGFTEDLSSLCLQGSGNNDDDMLITNGMNQYVCVHDFSMGISEESIDSYLDSWDD